MKKHRHNLNQLCLPVFLLVLFLLNPSLSVLAQTQFQIPTYGEDLEQGYRDELNNWLLKAYEGDAEAQFRAGVLFANDQFDNADLEQATYWYKQAAQQGHALAQYNLGHHYLTGSGLEISETDAMHWWHQAAEQDHALAQFNIGRAYYMGIGMQKDLDKARYWLLRAAYNNEPKSIEIVQQLGWEDQGFNTMANTPSESSPSPSPISSASLSPDPSPISNPSPSPSPDPIIDVNTDIQETSSNPVIDSLALYTDPAIKYILITVLENRDNLAIVDQKTDWLEIKKSDGFPVWVHSNFLELSGDTATLLAKDVNARSVPLVSPGTIVGRLSEGEKVRVLGQQSKWVRIQSPPRFTAWVKVEDFDRINTSKWSVGNRLMKQ